MPDSVGLRGGSALDIGQAWKSHWCWEWASWGVCCLLLPPGQGPAGRPAPCLTPAGAFTGLRRGSLCGSVVLTLDGADIYLSRAKSPHNRGFPQGGLPHAQVSVPNQTAWGGVGSWLGKGGYGKEG